MPAGKSKLISMASSGKRGVPSKFSDEVARVIIECVAIGMTLSHAARYAGIEQTTLWRWRCQGMTEIENGIEGKFASFCKSLQKAAVQSEKSILQNIHNAAKMYIEQPDGSIIKNPFYDLKANMFLLERRFPEQWGKRTEVNVNLNSFAAKMANDSGMSISDIVAIMEKKESKIIDVEEDEIDESHLLTDGEEEKENDDED
jgi:transposase-like protein